MPYGPATLGATPSHACRAAQAKRDGTHDRCPGQFTLGFFRRARSQPCSCSCHQPAPTVGPKGGSGASDVDRTTRDLADWYSTTDPKRFRKEFLNEPELPPKPSDGLTHRDRYPIPGMIAAGGWSVPHDQAYDFGDLEPVTPDEEHMPKVSRCVSTGRADPPEIQPEAAKLMGWVDEAEHFERTGELQGPDEMVDIAMGLLSKPIGYRVPESLSIIEQSRRLRVDMNMTSYVLDGQGTVHESFTVPDEMNYETLAVGRSFGKNASAEQWRTRKLDELEARGGGVIATILSQAAHQLAQANLNGRLVEAARAIGAGKGLAVIRGEMQLLDAAGNVCREGAIYDLDSICRMRLQDTYIPTAKVPVGVIYDFPHQAAYDAWEDRNAD